MGQYYMTYTKNGRKTKIYNRDVIVNDQPEYTMAKLTEHSWWFNEFVNGVCKDIYENENPTIVAWVGDYANELCDFDEPIVNNLTKEQVEKIHNQVWHSKGVAVKENDFTLFNKFLVNETKKEFIDCNLYFKNCSDDDWCLHLLPLLTCIGNGLGGGDYRYPSSDSTFDLVGSWALDKISIQDIQPQNYIEIQPIFKENY